MARGFRPIQHTKFPVPSIERTIQVSYRHQVHFTEGVFQPSNPLLRDIMIEGATRQRHKAIVVVDEALSQSQPFLVRSIENYFASHRELQLVCAPIIIEGGERTKNSYFHVSEIHSQIDRFHVDRHSYVIAVGGGALLDMVGLAAATAHRSASSTASSACGCSSSRSSSATTRSA